VLARFVGVVRSAITMVAGAARMKRAKYFLYSTIGALIWAAGMTLTGYFLGRVPFVRRHVQPHLDLFVLIAVVGTLVTVAVHLVLDRRKRPADDSQAAVDEGELVDARSRG
jgi:membrane-associated protein